MKKRVRITESQLRNIVTKAVKRVVMEENEFPKRTQQGFKIRYAGKAEGWDNGFEGYYVCTPKNGLVYCDTLKEAEKIIKQCYEGESREYVLNQLYGKINETKLRNTTRKFSKRVLKEGGNITWKDEDGRMHTDSTNTWRGVKGSTFVWHGEWSDPEIYFEYKDQQYILNGNEAEDWLWDMFKEYCKENNLNPNEHFNDDLYYEFAKNNAEDVLLDMGPYNESYGL